VSCGLAPDLAFLEGSFVAPVLDITLIPRRWSWSIFSESWHAATCAVLRSIRVVSVQRACQGVGVSSISIRINLTALSAFTDSETQMPVTIPTRGLHIFNSSPTGTCIAGSR
jgi:hypothetical protein